MAACQCSGFSAYASVSIDETASKIVRKSLQKYQNFLIVKGGFYLRYFASRA